MKETKLVMENKFTLIFVIDFEGAMGVRCSGKSKRFQVLLRQ
jgi:hypothetical protein